MPVDLAVAPHRERTGSVRRPIGGIVGPGIDELALARLGRALGEDAELLAPPHRSFVGEWDACSVKGRHEWERVLAAGRLAEVEGAFAVAWLDADGTVNLARDPVGERSLFYAQVGDRLAFASSVQALMSVVPARLNEHAVPAYLSYGYVPGRETLVDGVFELLPGERVSFAHARVRREMFWSLPAEDDPPWAEDEYRETLRAKLQVAVVRRLPESGPLAATLSGGIDSSLVVALARRLYDGPLTAYSLSFGRGIPNEIPFAALVAKHCGVPHRVVELAPRTVMDRFDATIGALSKPIGEPLTVANALLFETIAPEAAVVLNGEGGDPCFGGPKNVPMILREIYGRESRERAYLLAHRKCFADLPQLLVPDLFAATRLEEIVAPHLTDPRWPTLVNRLNALNVVFKGGHHILTKVDQLSRAGGVLARSPLFDRTIVEAASRMPADLKLNGTVEKHILKRAVDDLLPQAILERRKSGMRVPVEAWLEGRFDRFARERILDGLAPWGLFRRPYLEALVRPGETPIPRRGVKIWLLLSLEAWLRTTLNISGS
jgi:asparagine synthase (glutamine-hydrolysing)